MPEIATITRAVQIGAESTPGTLVPATKQLRAVGVEPSIRATIQSIRAVGGKFPIASALGTEWVEADIDGYATYDEMVYLLASVLQKVTPTRVNPPTGLAWKWTFAPAQSAEDQVQTYSVETGSPARAARWTYGLVTGLAISFSPDSVKVKGSMIGRKIEDGVSMTASPAVVPVTPILPGSVSVYLDADSASFGTTKLSRVLSAELEVADRFGPLWTVDAAAGGFAAHVETEPKATLKLMLEADAQGMALLDAARTGTKQYVQVKATGPQIETGTNHNFLLNLSGTVTDIGKFGDQDGVYAIEWTLSATHDATWGRALEIELTNTVSAL